MKTLQERFEAKYIPEPNSGCWLWTAAVCSGGYGCIGETKTRKILSAHRVSWELHCSPIPEGLDVLHKCDVRPCVNPQHLFLGTDQDNVNDKIAKGRGTLGKRWKQKNPRKTAPSGEHHHYAKLTEAQVVEIISSTERGSGVRLAEKFGVARSVISQIKNRKAWKHVLV
jgi:hypothetical protein